MGKFKVVKKSKRPGKSKYSGSIASIYLDAIASGQLDPHSPLLKSDYYNVSETYTSGDDSAGPSKRENDFGLKPYKVPQFGLGWRRLGSLSRKERLLIDSAASGNLILVTKLLNDWVNPSVQDHNGRSPLHFASSKGNQSMVQALIEAGADINLTDQNNNTPLDLAALSNYFSVVVKLTEAGGRVNDSKTKNEKDQLGKLRNPIRMIKARLSALRSCNLEINEQFLSSTLAILDLLGRKLNSNNRSNQPQTSHSDIVPPSDQDQPDSKETDFDLEELCHQIQHSLTLAKPNPILSLNPLAPIAPLPVVSTPELNIALDKLSQLLCKLDI